MTTKTIKQIFPLLCVLACLAYGIDAQIINEFPNGAVTLNSLQTISGVKNFTATPTLQCGTEPTPLASQKYVDGVAAGLEEMLMRTDGSNAAPEVSLQGLNADYLDLPVSGSNPAYEHGRLFWDTDDDTLAVYTENASFVHQVGQELVVRAKNLTGATILDGQAVYISSTTVGIHPTARLAIANSTATADVIAIATHNVGDNEFGHFTMTGIVRTLNTSGFAGGSTLYLSQTTAGSYTATVPPSGIVAEIGHVVMTHATEGSIFVRPRVNGSLTRANFSSGIDVAGNVSLATPTADTHAANKGYNDNTYAKLAGNVAQDFAVKSFRIATTTESAFYGIVAAAPFIITTNDSGSVFKAAPNQSTNRIQTFYTASSGQSLWSFGNNTEGSPPTKQEFFLKNWVTSTVPVRVNAGGEVCIATSTDAGDYKLQVNGNAYISATCSAAAFEDRSAAPDTVADAYAIVQSHEAKNGHVDHSKLHPKLWGTKLVQVSSKQVEKQVAVRDTEGKETEEFETITVQEPVIEIVPDQSKRNLSMLISAQSEVLKDIDKRLKALENNK